MIWKQNRFKLSLAIFFILISISITSAAILEPPLKVALKYRLGLSSTDIGPQTIHLIVSDIAYVDYGRLKAIDVNNGRLLWSKEWSAGVAYKDGILYAARAFSQDLYALNASTGDEIWRKALPELREIPGYYDLAILNNSLIAVTKGYYVMDVQAFDANGDPHGYYEFDVFAFNLEGDLKWHRNFTGNRNLGCNIASDLIIIPYVIYSPDYRDNIQNLIALNMNTGETVWEIKNISSEGTPLSYKDILFIDCLRENDNFEYLFNWDEVPGNDNVRFIEFLKQEFGISWVENANIEKFDNGREIRVIAEINYLSFGLYDENTRVNLQIDDGRNAEFTAKNETGKLKIYGSEKFYILAVSGATGETIWKKKVGNSYGNILTVKDNKLFVNSEMIKVLDPETGETLDEYSNALDTTSTGSILGFPGLLGYNSVVISDNILYAVSTGPSPSIYSIDLNTGKLLWKGGKGGISPYIYKDRLYLIVFGQLYAYEPGLEEKNEVAKFQFFVLLGIPLILINLFIRFKKYSGRLYQSFQFSSILIIIVFLLILASETLSNQYLNLMDERLIISTPPDWMFYLLFPAISVIAGTFAGMRFNNKFLISAVSGLAPFILAVAVSFLYLSISDKIIFLFSMVPLFISIPIIILISLFYGVIGSIIGCILEKNNGV